MLSHLESTILSLGTHVHRGHALVCAVCEVQQLTFSLEGSISFPGLTTGQSCKSSLTGCVGCIANPSLSGVLPAIACELTKPTLISGTFKLAVERIVLPIEQSDLSLTLSEILETEAPEVVEVLNELGTDVTWSIPLSSIQLYLAGGKFQVQMAVDVFDIEKSAIASNSKLKGVFEAFLGTTGLFTNNKLYSDNINLGMEVADFLKAANQPALSWLESTGSIDIGDVSKTGEVCDATPRKFGVAVTGLTADELTTNQQSVASALAKLLTTQSNAHSNMPVLASQITGLKMCGTDSKALCGDMRSGAGFEAGGLNDFLAQLAAKNTNVPISSATSFTLTGIVTKDTDFTCSAAAEKAGGCPKSFVPGGAGGGGANSGGGGSGSSSTGSSDSGVKTHRLTAGDITAVVLGTLGFAAIVVVGALRWRHGSFAAIAQRSTYTGRGAGVPPPTSAAAPGHNVINPVA